MSGEKKAACGAAVDRVLFSPAVFHPRHPIEYGFTRSVLRQVVVVYRSARVRFQVTFSRRNCFHPPQNIRKQLSKEK